MWTRRSIIALAAVTTATAAACKPKEDAVVTPPVDVSTPQHIMASDQSFIMNLPGRWAGVTRTDTLSTVERGTAQPGALNIVYIPRDTAIIPQTLVVIAAYDSAAWKKVKSDGGPPPGDSVAVGNGRVYTVGLPQSNPFTAGSVDAMKFDSLTLKPAEITNIISVPIKK